MKKLLLLAAITASACTGEPSAAVKVQHKMSEGDTASPAPLHPLTPTDEALATSTTTTAVPTPSTTTEPASVTTTTPAPRRTTTTTVYEAVPSPQGRSTGRGSEPPAGDVLACIRSYEQGAAGYATDTGNGYYGAYQFDLATWASVGGSGLPSDASPAEQDMRAGMLIARRGLAPWPTPNRMCQ